MKIKISDKRVINGTTWAPEIVAQYFEEAVSTTRKLPPVRAQGYFNAMPAIIHTPNELMMQEPKPIRLKATPDAISRLEQTFEWMSWLTVEQRKLVWRRGSRIGWRSIGREFACNESAASYKWRQALIKISSHLNKSSTLPDRRVA